MTASQFRLTRDRPIGQGRAALLAGDAQNETCGPKDATKRPEFHQAATARAIPTLPDC
jgi:hypothetical protein